MTRTALVVIAIGVRLAVSAAAWLAAHDPQRFLTGDSPTYLELAGSLLHDGSYRDTLGPNLNRPPGYPVLLAAGVALGHPVAFACFAQALLGGLATLALFEATRVVAPRTRAPAWAAALMALDPVTIAWSSSVMAEALLASLVSLALLAVARALETPTAGRVALAGAAFAVSAYAKPIVTLALPVLALALVLLLPVAGRGRRARLALAFLATGAATLAPWTLRNGAVAGYWWFSSVSDRVLAFSAPASVVAAGDGRTFSEARDDWRRRLQTPGFESPERLAALRSDGLQRIREAPGTYALIHARGMARVLLAPGSLPFLDLFGAMPRAADGRGLDAVVKDDGAAAALRGLRGAPLGLVLALSVVQAAVVAAALRGVLRPPASAARFAGLCAVLVATLLALSVGAWGQSRFRAPIAPELAVLAGLGLARPRP